MLDVSICSSALSGRAILGIYFCILFLFVFVFVFSRHGEIVGRVSGAGCSVHEPGPGQRTGSAR